MNVPEQLAVLPNGRITAVFPVTLRELTWILD
jgi:hypothetical protein